MEGGTEITKNPTGDERIPGFDENEGGETGYSQPGIHTTATVPNTYPPQPNAGVHVIWTVIAKGYFSDTIFCDTTLANYVADVSTQAQAVYNLWQAWAHYPKAISDGDPYATPTGLGYDVEIHWAIKLDNPTAPPPQMGSWVQAKQHYDGHLSWGNIKSVADIESPILNNIPFMQKIAKY